MTIWFDPPEKLEEIDNDNIISLDDRRKTVKVQMEEELEVVDENDIEGRLAQMDKTIEKLNQQCDETDKIFEEVMGKDHPLARAQRTVEKVKKPKPQRSLADQLKDWQQRR